MDSLDFLDVWTLHLETESKNIQRANQFYGFSGLSGRLDFLDTPFRDRIKNFVLMLLDLSGLSGLSGRLDTAFRDIIKKYSRGKSKM